MKLRFEENINNLFYLMVIYTFVFVPQLTNAQEYIDFKIRTDDFYANTSSELGNPDPTWWVRIMIDDYRIDEEFYVHDNGSKMYGLGRWYEQPKTIRLTGQTLTNLDDIKIYFLGWEEEDSPVYEYNGDDRDLGRYYGNSDHFCGNNNNEWFGYQGSNEIEAGDSDNNNYKVELDLWWDWSLPKDPAFSISSNEGNLIVELTNNNNYRITSWDYQVLTNDKNVVAYGTVNSVDQLVSVAGLNTSINYYIRILGENEAGKGDWTGTLISDWENTIRSQFIYSGGSGTEDNPFLIGNPSDLIYLSNHQGDFDKYFLQINDIIFNEDETQVDWDGDGILEHGVNGDDSFGFLNIGRDSNRFTGFYNGNGKKIENLFINRPTDSDLGLFGYIGESGSILNCSVLVKIQGSSNVGALVGKNSGTITNCYSTGSVSGEGNDIGGLVGKNFGTIANSYSTGSVSSGSSGGGLVGFNYGTITNSYSTGSVSCGDSGVGGLVGYNYGTITNSYSTGSVSGENFYIGGLVGLNNYTITNCFWNIETSGMTSSDGGTGITTSNMKSASTFINAGWDPTIWCIDESTENPLNDGYLYLSWQNSGGGSPLPVELTSFRANVTEKNVVLNWETATEVNNYGFEIDRSNKNDKSGIRIWETIGFVEGHGTINSPQTYSFVDYTLPTGKVQYRLKQIDTDGKFEYSDIEEIEIENPNELVLSQNYPNPFNPETTIEYFIPNIGTSHETSVRLTIFDILGKKIETLVNEPQFAGHYKIKFNGINLSSGMYVYQLSVGNSSTFKKLMLIK